MSQSLFLHLTTKFAWEDALAVGVYSLSAKGKTLEKVVLFTDNLPIKLLLRT